MAIQRSGGFSVLELMVVVCALGVLLAVGFARLDPQAAELNRAAADFQAVVQRARFDAIRLNQNVAVDLAGLAGGRVNTCLDSGSVAGTCETSGERRLDFWRAADYRAALTRSHTFASGLVWTADGLPQSSSGGATSGSLTLTRRGVSRRVFVDVGGRVRRDF